MCVSSGRCQFRTHVHQVGFDSLQVGLVATGSDHEEVRRQLNRKTLPPSMVILLIALAN
jgi:hypothetical protein